MLRLTQIILLISSGIAAAATADNVATQKCFDDGYSVITKENNSFCKFRDSSECPIEQYNNFKCISQAEQLAIQKYQEKTGLSDSTSDYSSFYNSTSSVDEWIPDILLPKDSGRGRAYFPAYAYNSDTKACEFFVYGGVGGNDNRFSTMAECNQMVNVYNHYRPTPRSLQATEDKELSEMCRRNGNYIITKENNLFCKFLDSSECPIEQYNNFKCISASEQLAIKQYLENIGRNADSMSDYSKFYDSIVSVEKWLPNVNLEKDPGMGRAYIKAYFFNNVIQKCEPFIYGGMGGNSNRFTTVGECLQMGHLYNFYYRKPY